MALDMTVNSNPLLNINVGEYGQYCLKTIYHIGTVFLYVIKKCYMHATKRSVECGKMSNGARQVRVRVKFTL